MGHAMKPHGPCPEASWAVEASALPWPLTPCVQDLPPLTGRRGVVH